MRFKFVKEKCQDLMVKKDVLHLIVDLLSRFSML
jgi:hypothetical protein